MGMQDVSSKMNLPKKDPKFVCILMGMLELKLESCWVEVGEEFQE
jgi:hypothetical protein